ncbi:MAG TPA: translocation/assembly module TamB domain-containing protein [Gemmatimonadaceae bacterium]|nr:translocation/assembly module TamB domain-containing protein [Gemmatimonadaceae bacterium]
MTRRRLVAIASAGLLLFVGVVIAGVLLALTQTDMGRAWVRTYVQQTLATALHGNGSMYIGRLGGNLLSGFTIDSLSIRDAEDSSFVTSGPVKLHYDLRDLVDKRIRLSSVYLERPVINLRRHADHSWNFQHIFPGGPPPKPGARRVPRPQELRFGDYITMSSVTIHDGTVILTEPWDAPDSLHGARRDSATRVALRDTSRIIRRTSEGVKQTRLFTHLELSAPNVRLADPDSSGRYVQVASLDVDINDPPFRVRHATGPVTIRGDSVWLSMRHFDLPGSTGSATAKVWWGGDIPTRYDVHVTADSVSLADVAWVYPTLPHTGGGHLRLTIHNELNLHVLDYVLSDMDVHTTRSRLQGTMTFAVGGPVLGVKDLAVTVSPLDFDLLRQFNGGPFPVDWQGQFTGAVRARGGPLTRFDVDDAHLEFHDAHVPGAVTTLDASGGALDILKPSQATFLGLHVTLASLDLRTIHYLFPSFAKLGGTISGTATLDSVWTDVRFSDADLTQHDGPAPPTHVTGRGRVTYGTTTAFDVDLMASPLSFTTLARSYPGLKFRDTYSGPLVARGTTSDLELHTELVGPAGAFGADGVFNLEPPTYGAKATFTAHDLDVPMLLADTTLMPARITGTMTADVHGDSVANLVGTASVMLDSSRVDSIDVRRSTASLAFGDGRMRVDSMAVATDLLRATAKGAIGLRPQTPDSLSYVVDVDSLGALAPLLGISVAATTGDGQPDTTADSTAIEDVLSGTLHGVGVLTGSIDTLETHGTVTGQSIAYGDNEIHHVSGSYAVHGLPHAPAGMMAGAMDSVMIANIRLDSIFGSVVLADRSSGSIGLVVVADSERGAYRAGARVAFARDSSALHLTVDTAGATLKDHAWHLERPAHIVEDSGGLAIDTAVMRSTAGGVLRVRGTIPAHEAIDAEVTGDSLALADVGTLLQTTRPLGGTTTFDFTMSGAREHPVMHGTSRFTDAQLGDVHVPYATLAGDYASRKLGAKLELYRKDTVVLTATATVPVDLALERVNQRLLHDSLSGQIRADSVDLSLLNAISPDFANGAGTASTLLNIGGTILHPTVEGAMRVNAGSVGLPRIGVQLTGIRAKVAFTADSVRVDTFTAESPGIGGSRVSLTGGFAVPNWRDVQTLGFGLTLSARSFQAIDKRGFAQLQVTGAMQLTGTFEQPVLQGDMTVDKGNLYISDIYRKQVVNLNDPEAYTIVDTNLVQNRSLLEANPLLDSLVTRLSIPSFAVRVGDDVWLRSEEANIKLLGSMTLAKAGTQRYESGVLRVSRGTYRLDLGVVQRTFQVDSGSVTFYGDPHIPPELSIWATYTVRQPSRQVADDVKLIAHISGTPTNPQLDLTSNSRFQLSNTEILSYLVFGQPSFSTNPDQTTNPVLQQVAAALLPSVGAVLERALADQIGFIDYVQVQTGSTNDPTTGATTGFLSGTRIGVGKQLGNKTFVTVNAGLCGLSGQQSGISFGQSLGLTVEQRLADGYSLQASIEPSSAALLCHPGLTSIGSRPPQYGIDLFREWSF